MKKWVSLLLVAAAALAGGMFLHANRARFDVPFWQPSVDTQNRPLIDTSKPAI